MSAVGQNNQQLQQDLHNELTTTNLLLRLISIELQEIKELTRAGGEFESNITQNTTLLETLANMQQVDLENLIPIRGKENT